MTKRIHRLFFGSILITAALAACKSSDPGGSGGAGGSGGNAPSTADCQPACENVSTTCMGNPTVDQCMQNCQNAGTMVPASCASEWGAYLACVAGASDIDCAQGGLGQIPSCNDEIQAYTNCYAGGTGGCTPLGASLDAACQQAGKPPTAKFCAVTPDPGCVEGGSNQNGAYCCP